MNCFTTHLSYESTGYFTKIVIDYVQQNKQLQDFYQHPVSIEGIRQSVKARQSFKTNRKLLVDELNKQYGGLRLSVKQTENITSLLSGDTFTITTAHQPNIFTGPLYFIYKIIHTIKLADELKQELPQYNFVPVYYMGSEDADLDELGYINLNGEKLVWATKQTGAVGRMKVDKAFIKLMDAVYGQIGVLPNGNELMQLFKQSYTAGKTIQRATLELVHTLFADFGLLVLIPDSAALKKEFSAIVEKELLEQFSYKTVEQTILALSKEYKVQTGGRELNLFYLVEDKRERIEIRDLKFEVRNLGITFTKEEILQELEQHPERFSANVILRGVFQETVLPGIAFIGGGGELAYWLELKKVFEAAGVPYPMLILRNSFLLLNEKQYQKWGQLGFTVEDLFKDEKTLLNGFVERTSRLQLNLNKEMAAIRQVYQQTGAVAGAVDKTLQLHAEALQAKALKPLIELEKKMIRAEKRKFATQQQQLLSIKNDLFPNNNLQERTENFSIFYAKYGKGFLQMIYNSSKGLQQEFGIIKAG